MIRFPYLSEPIGGPAPPSLPQGSMVRWRPLVPIRLVGPGDNRQLFPRALMDTGADDCVFPLSVARLLGIVLYADPQLAIRWRGQAFPLQFGDVELELTDDVSTWRWPATIGFSAAPIRYPLLGYCGCLQFFDASFYGDRQLIELETNSLYPGTC